MPGNTNWVSLVSDGLSVFERGQVGSPCPVVDHEVFGSASDSPDDMTAWLICRNNAERRQFVDTELPRAISSLKKTLLAAGFPESAVASLTVRVTSRDEVNARGYAFLRS